MKTGKRSDWCGLVQSRFSEPSCIPKLKNQFRRLLRRWN